MAGGQMDKQVKYKSSVKDQGTPGFLRIREGMVLFVPDDPKSDSKLEIQTQNNESQKFNKKESNRPPWLNLTNKQGRSHIFEFENYSDMHACRDHICKLLDAVMSPASANPIYGKLVPQAPDRPDLSKFLSQDRLDFLEEYGHCHPNEDQVQLLVGLSKYQHINREGQFGLNDSDDVAMLTWQIKESELSFVEEIRNEARSGCVRNQMFHLLCWAYVASDLVSGVRRLQQWEDEILTLCTWYLCSFCNPQLLGKNVRVDKEGNVHHCYGSTIESALRYIQMNGIPRERGKTFFCTDYHPPSANEPGMERRTIKKVKRIDTLEEALKVVKTQPVGADLIHYTGLQIAGKHIYYGPKAPGSDFVGYHAVVIEGVEKINGEFTAVCKLSNGTGVADEGYAYVSLATQYMPVGVGSEKKTLVMGSSEPMHLLTNFIVPEIDLNKDGGDADASDLMTDILGQVATKTESINKAGNDALLDECVETIMTIEDTSSLRVLAINILGRFLSNRDNNIRYAALNMLMKAITFDDEAVQRHRATILECVKDPDACIRKRALELTKELIGYLEISDEDYKEDLSAKICSIVEKCSRFCRRLESLGKFGKDEVWHALIVVISNAPELHGYAVRALYKTGDPCSSGDMVLWGIW